MSILTIGEVLWDVFGEVEFLGGAPLNFSAGLQRLGNSVTLISGVGQDQRGARAIQSMAALGLTTQFVQTVPGRETGTAKVTIDTTGNAHYFIQRPAAFDDLALSPTQLPELIALHPQWLYFGTLAQTNGTNVTLINDLVHEIPDMKCFYDINLRKGHWDIALVEKLSALASILKLNEEEAEMLFALVCAPEEFSLEKFCAHWSATYNVETICITRGGDGCAIFSDKSLNYFEGFHVNVVDTVGAGDAFAAGFLHGHIQGWPNAQKASFANALGALVASRPGATPAWTVDECLQLITA